MLLQFSTDRFNTIDLIEQLKEPNRQARLRTAAVLCLRARLDNAVAPALAMALEHDDQQVRKTAALILGQIGSHAKTAVPALIEALADDSETVRRRVVMTLGDLGSDAGPAIPALSAITRDAEPNMQSLARAALERIELAPGHRTAAA